ncbi:hypothetical protein CTI14_66905, partial [Methylobacterium radiotolerans]
TVAPLFWAFRIMVAVGMYLILFFGVAFWLASRAAWTSVRRYIKQAAIDTVPTVAPLFWAFRIMVAVGMYLILFFGVAFWLASR